MTILDLLDKYLREAIEQMERDRVKMKFFGDISILSPELRQLIAEAAEISTHFEGCQVNVCVNYGGRAEILRAADACVEEALRSGLAGSLSEDFISLIGAPEFRIPIS